MTQAKKKTPPQKPKKPALKAVQRPGENGFKYQQKYGLVVLCDDEAHQQATFARLARLKPALSLKVVCV